MSRPRKSGLDYFPFDVGFFEDKKIRALKGKYGSGGVLSYIYILCQIYNDKGYYAELNEDFILCMSDDMNITEESTKQILKYLISRSLLCEIKDSTLAKPVTIITAKSVQRRYQEAKKGLKRDVFVEAKYWVLEKFETLSFIKVYPNENKSEKNNNISEKNNNKSEIYATKESKVKESKVKESKGNESKGKESRAEESELSSVPPHSSDKKAWLSEESYKKLVYDYGEDMINRYIDKANNWAEKKNFTIGECEAIIRKWLIQDNVKKLDHLAEKYAFLINNI